MLIIDKMSMEFRIRNKPNPVLKQLDSSRANLNCHACVGVTVRAILNHPIRGEVKLIYKRLDSPKRLHWTQPPSTTPHTIILTACNLSVVSTYSFAINS